MRGRATLSDPQRQNGGLLMAILTERAHNAAQPALHHTSGPPCPVLPVARHAPCNRPSDHGAHASQRHDVMIRLGCRPCLPAKPITGL